MLTALTGLTPLFADMVAVALYFIGLSLLALLFFGVIYFAVRRLAPAEAQEPARWIIGVLFLLVVVAIAYYAWTGHSM